MMQLGAALAMIWTVADIVIVGVIVTMLAASQLGGAL
jgi:hypothetical protein